MPIQMWHTILVEYGKDGPKILRSFSRPAKESDAKFNKKAKPKRIEVENSTSEVDLFE